MAQCEGIASIFDTYFHNCWVFLLAAEIFHFFFASAFIWKSLAIVRFNRRSFFSVLLFSFFFNCASFCRFDWFSTWFLISDCLRCFGWTAFGLVVALERGRSGWLVAALERGIHNWAFTRIATCKPGQLDFFLHLDARCIPQHSLLAILLLSHKHSIILLNG